jgi:hypothetical protein
VIVPSGTISHYLVIAIAKRERRIPKKQAADQPQLQSPTKTTFNPLVGGVGHAEVGFHDDRQYEPACGNDADAIERKLGHQWDAGFVVVDFMIFGFGKGGSATRSRPIASSNYFSPAIWKFG